MEALSDAPGDRRIEIRTRSAGACAELCVSGAGPGIPANAIDSVFQPFYTTKKEGLGMGLSISRSIIEAHGGRISAENRIEGAAAFRVALPRATAG